MITIKSIGVFEGVLEVSVMPVLINIVSWIYNEHDKKIVITSGFRMGDMGVHGQRPLRGLDIRSRIYSDPNRLCQMVNDRWEYDWVRPEMKCAILHGKDVHIHLQVHPRTRLKITTM